MKPIILISAFSLVCGIAVGEYTAYHRSTPWMVDFIQACRAEGLQEVLTPIDDAGTEHIYVRCDKITGERK